MEQAGQFLVVVEHMAVGLLGAVKTLRLDPEWRDLGVVLLTSRAGRNGKYLNSTVPVQTVLCEFEKPASIAAALAPYLERIRGVVCRGDGFIQQLIETLPHFPKHILAPSPRALRIATDKRLMRKAFLEFFPEISPQFIEVKDSTPETIAEVSAALQYPVIVKPSNLASSLMIQSCESPDVLQPVLTLMFNRIEEIYHREKRRQLPRVIVEEYLEGDFYSIDAYVAEPGNVKCCPPVSYVPAKQLGIDDFFLYKRLLPVELSEDEIAAANKASEKAISAAGLTYSTVHVELVRTRNGWKIIEIGPRPGRFRHKMYQASYGIDPSLNDVKLHLGLPLVIPEKLRCYSATYSIYPRHEGRLKSINGIEALRNQKEIVWQKVYAHSGDVCLHAKHGGHALAEILVVSADKDRFAEACKKVEKVYADIA
jgi:D-alanine-D-alanine ligase-like ATP-grasp enzyme